MISGCDGRLRLSASRDASATEARCAVGRAPGARTGALPPTISSPRTPERGERPVRRRLRAARDPNPVTRSLLPLVGADPNQPGAISLVGRYALGVTWRDGHGSIYPFVMLRVACPCGGCPPSAEAWPTEIRREAADLHIAWQDGHQSALPYADLRGHCPCAQCTAAPRGATR